jgi:hypothetical protein
MKVGEAVNFSYLIKRKQMKHLVFVTTSIVVCTQMGWKTLFIAQGAFARLSTTLY